MNLRDFQESISADLNWCVEHGCDPYNHVEGCRIRTLTVDDVLDGNGLPIEVAKSMLAAVMVGRKDEISRYLWMRLLTTYIDLANAAVDRAIDEAEQRPMSDAVRDAKCPHGRHFGGHWCEDCADALTDRSDDSPGRPLGAT